MKTFIFILMLALFVCGCKPEEKKIPFESASESSLNVSDDKKSSKTWESEELEKHGLSKNSSVQDIIESKDKPSVDEIINWNQ